ncbi:MAG: propionyl-CoA synthetase, partial [Gammaproteobacteria bacterium]|nr:propionyl-CoA synthetase [Gammaproteobacteria bacterium]
KSGVRSDIETVSKEVVALVREKIGPVCAFKKVATVEHLPKTRSGKILRGVMKKIADSESYRIPATIDDPVVLDEVRVALQSIGYAEDGR